MQFVLGLKLEKTNHRSLAHDLYKSALDIDPKNQQIKDRIDSLMTGLPRILVQDMIISFLRR